MCLLSFSVYWNGVKRGSLLLITQAAAAGRNYVEIFCPISILRPLYFGPFLRKIHIGREQFLNKDQSTRFDRSKEVEMRFGQIGQTKVQTKRSKYRIVRSNVYPLQLNLWSDNFTKKIAILV